MNRSTLNAWSAIEKRLSALTSPGAIPGLVFVEKLMKKLGDPTGFPAIHVAGTNGKGSVCACLDSMLRQAGYRSALYTSPHLSYLGERLLIDGKPLSVQKWSEAVERVSEALADLGECPVNYFQALTAASFLLIRQERADAAVIETGLGGRLDATNILPAPLISVITPLGMDHMEILGDTLPKIAAEKFGIVKAHCRALYCGGSEDLNSQFLARCAETGAEGEIFSENCRIYGVQSSLDGNAFRFQSPQGTRELFVRLAGAYQPENASLALRALELVADRLPVTAEAAELGLKEVLWPGRMEVLHRNPDLIIDGAHNPHGTRALIRSLLALYGSERPISLVYTSMADKDYMESLELYAAAFPKARLFCTELEENHRCEAAAKLAERASALAWGEAPQVEKDPLAAIGRAKLQGDPVIVCGSLYFIGRVRGDLIQNEL